MKGKDTTHTQRSNRPDAFLKTLEIFEESKRCTVDLRTKGSGPGLTAEPDGRRKPSGKPLI